MFENLNIKIYTNILVKLICKYRCMLILKNGHLGINLCDQFCYLNEDTSIVEKKPNCQPWMIDTLHRLLFERSHHFSSMRHHRNQEEYHNKCYRK